VIEEKPEVRKAGGVYYTPEYIVEYIVKNTVGKALAGSPPLEGLGEVLKIVDPACGSGSFLIGAYEYLLKHHHDFYLAKYDELDTIVSSKELNTKDREKARKERDKLPLTPLKNLTTAVKKQILLNNIFGVDIDAQAVEVTKLSLMLKCMEGETTSSINAELNFGERVLPTLDENIKCGNSLIDVDFYDSEIDFGTSRKIKPFNWQDAFPKVFQLKKRPPTKDFIKQYNKVKKLQEDADDLIDKHALNEPEAAYEKVGGFDIIIGNPPYGALFSTDEIDYFKNRYRTAVWRGESYVMFIEQGLKLLKPDGLLGFIIPDTLLNLGFTQPARELLLRNSRLQEIIGLPSNVFSGATVDTIILITEKAEYTAKFHPSNVSVKTFGKKQEIQSVENAQKEFFVKTKEWFEQENFNLQMDEREKLLLLKIESEKKIISDISQIFYGIKVYQIGKGKPAQTKKIRDEKPFTSEKKIGESWLPFYDGKNIGRYELYWKNNNWINYGKWLAEPRNPTLFEGEKILIRKITGKTLIATYVPETSYCNTLLFVLKLKQKSYSYKSVLAILNSTLIGWYFRKKFQISDDDTFPQIMIRDILQFPVPAIPKKYDEELNKLVNDLLNLNREKQQTALPHKLEQLNTRIEYTNEKINKLVFELYGLNEEERRIVENA
jgi:hypothetical protein